MALVVTVMMSILLATLGSALALLAGMESRISGNYRAGSEALYAADAALELAVEELRSLPDWAPVLDGRAASWFVRGEASGTHHTAAGPIDLSEATNLPGWQLYARGDLRDFVGVEGLESANYVVVWITPVPTGEADRLAIRAEAHGPAGVRRAVEVRVSREGPAPGIRRLSWQEVR